MLHDAPSPARPWLCPPAFIRAPSFGLFTQVNRAPPRAGAGLSLSFCDWLVLLKYSFGAKLTEAVRWNTAHLRFIPFWFSELLQYTSQWICKFNFEIGLANKIFSFYKSLKPTSQNHTRKWKCVRKSSSPNPKGESTEISKKFILLEARTTLLYVLKMRDRVCQGILLQNQLTDRHCLHSTDVWCLVWVRRRRWVR